MDAARPAVERGPTLRLLGSANRIEAVGLHYRLDDCEAAFRSLRGRSDEWNGDASVVLWRDRHNAHSPNDTAIAVDLAGRQIGFLPAEAAERYAPALDAAGTPWQGFRAVAHISRAVGDRAYFHLNIHLADPACVVPVSGNPNEPGWFSCPRHQMALTATAEGATWARSNGAADRGSLIGAWATLDVHERGAVVSLDGVGVVGTTPRGSVSDDVVQWLSGGSDGRCFVPLLVKGQVKGPKLVAMHDSLPPAWLQNNVRLPL